MNTSAIKKTKANTINNNPAKFASGLEDAPAPQWGFYAQLLRALMDSFLLYLPLFLLGRIPPTPSYLPIFSTENYYGTLVFLAPLVLTAQWLLGSSLIHLVLRLVGRRSEFDKILNINGMATLVVGAFLIVWDWVWIVMGWQSDVLLGISHLVLVIWAIVITVVGFRRILGLPTWLAILLNVLWVVLGEPLGAIFMRAPV